MLAPANHALPMEASTAQLQRLLAWYHDAGVDVAVQEVARNYMQRPLASSPSAMAGGEVMPAALALAEPAPTPYHAAPVAALPQNAAMAVPRPRSAPAGGLGGGMGSPAAAAAEAAALAEKATTLDALFDAIRGFEGCSIKRTAMHTVIADGNPAAPVLFIGEAPGAEEDKRGIPFCGASGQLLDRMLASIGLDRTNVYISNTVYWRPPGNRQPNKEELMICAPFVRRLIQLVAPKLIVAVGGTASSALLQTEQGITKLRGKPHRYPAGALANADQTAGEGGDGLPCFVLFHPSYLLRQPAHKALAWRDLLQIRAWMAQNGLISAS